MLPQAEESQPRSSRVLVLGAGTAIGRAAVKHLQDSPHVDVFAGIYDPNQPLDGSDSFRRDITPEASRKKQVSIIQVNTNRSEMVKILQTGKNIPVITSKPRESELPRAPMNISIVPSSENNIEASTNQSSIVERARDALSVLTPFNSVTNKGEDKGEVKSAPFFDRVLLVVPHYCPRGVHFISEALHACAEANVKLVALVSSDEFGEDSLYVKHYQPLEDLMRSLCSEPKPEIDSSSDEESEEDSTGVTSKSAKFNKDAMHYCILRIPMLMDNFLGHAPTIRSQGLMFDARQETKSFVAVSVDDVGRAAARVIGPRPDALTEHFDRTYRITGPTTTLDKVCDYLTKKLRETALLRNQEEEAQHRHRALPFLGRRHLQEPPRNHNQHDERHHRRFPNLRILRRDRNHPNHDELPEIHPQTVTYSSFKVIFVPDQPQWMTDGFVQLCMYVNDERPIMTRRSNDFRKITGESATSIEKWVDEHLEFFESEPQPRSE